MNTNKHAIALALASLCATAAMPAHAVKIAGDLLEIYGNLYPEYERSKYTSGPVGNGIDAGNLTTGTTNPLYNRTSAQSAAKPSFTKLQWSNSYLGFKGQRKVRNITLGYDLQAVVTPDDTATTLFGATRDAFVFVEVDKFGRIQAGSMDTPYKDYGDRYRMLGVSSSNFVSTSGVLSQPAWKGGTTTFHTRAANQVRYISPTLYGVEGSIGFSNNPSNATPQGQQQGARLLAYGLKWQMGPYYASVQREEHRNYMPFSSGSAFAPKTVAIANTVTTTTGGVTTASGFTTGRSNDNAQRLSLGYENFGVRVGFDVSRLRYSEDTLTAGKFSNYHTTTWQLSAEYDLMSDITIAANYARGAKGSCALSGGVACSTNGLGGHEMNVGALYTLEKGLGIFALAGKYANGAGGAYGSPSGTVAGGGTIDVAVGLSVRF